MMHLRYIHEVLNAEADIYVQDLQISEIRSTPGKDNECHLTMRSGHTYLIPISAKDLLVLIAERSRL